MRHAGPARGPAWAPRRALALAVAVGILVAGAAAVDPGGAATAAAITVIHVYRATLARAWPLLGVHCRFQPTCSHYAEAAIGRYGVLRGGWLSLTRLLRCGPWTPMGTADPLPPPGSLATAPGRAREAPHPA